MEKQKLGFIAQEDLDDRTRWSGTISFLKDVLSQNYDIIPIIVKEPFLKRAIRKIVKILIHRKTISMGISFVEKTKCQKLVNQAAAEGCKIFFAPSAADLIYNIKIPSDTRLIYLSDSTYHSMIDYYFFEPKYSQRIGNNKEKKL